MVEWHCLSPAKKQEPTVLWEMKGYLEQSCASLISLARYMNKELWLKMHGMHKNSSSSKQQTKSLYHYCLAALEGHQRSHLFHISTAIIHQLLNLKGSRSSMYDIYTQNLQASPKPWPKIKLNWGFETLFSTLSYVKDNIKINSYVTLIIRIVSLYLHPRHSDCIFDTKSTITLRLNKSHPDFSHQHLQKLDWTLYKKQGVMAATARVI